MQYTKRFILRLAGRIHDPVGFLAPFVVRIKCLLQELWKAGLGWDEEIPNSMKEAVNSWCSEIKSMPHLAVPRYYFASSSAMNDPNCELHVFSDANPQTYGAVAYFRYFDDKGNPNCSLVMSKSRVAQIKKLSLPRIELMGALIAARLAKYLINLFKIPNNKVHLWADSSIALFWIKGPADKWKQFVSNRVVEIQELVDPACWRHCSGSINPADKITKGAKLEKLLNDENWWSGPDFLKRSKEEWPRVISKLVHENLIEKNEEVLISPNVCENTFGSETFFDFEKFSSFMKIVRIMAWIIRFIRKLRKSTIVSENVLNSNEIKNAEEVLIKNVQIQSFPNEYAALRNRSAISKDSKLAELSPFIDDSGVLRLKGRLQNSKFHFEEKHPILLPAKHKITELIIKYVHERVAHSGVAHTLDTIRSKYWIIKGRQYVKSVLNRCTVCKRYSSRPGAQVMAPLPTARCSESPPFNICGLDFAGPLFCKNSDTKYYILLVTCAVTRAIHLELVNSLTTESFLLAFRRFIARRGLCQIIYSDNAQTFKRAEQDLQKIFRLINHPDVKSYYAFHGIQWRYIVDRGAWWGGFYERLVRSVKTSLRKTISRSSLTVCELETILIEIEAIINSRPITYVYSDFNEPIALTPAHFLVGKRLTSLPPVKIYDEAISSTRDILIKRYNYRENLLQHFWNRWRKEYILNLKSANSIIPVKRVTDIKVNDIVLLSDKRYPRNIWRLAKVIEVFTGRDGKVRSCLLKTSTGTIKRPVQLLHSLEVK